MPRVRGRLAIAAAALSVTVLAGGCGADHPSGTPSADGLVTIGAGLRGPAGLAATVYATGLSHASAFAFGTGGDLFVATAASSDVGTDGVYIVTAARATPVKVIADVHTPLGLLWLGGSLYVASKDRVDMYSDFDGAHFARTTTIVAMPDGTGELNGLALAPDGRISMGISAPCDHCTPSSPWSGTVVSFLPDGRDLRVDASGIRAPVGLAYFPGTSDLFVTMNQRDDLGALTPGDWLGVVEPGQAWGFPACYGQGGAACAGVPAPTAVLDAHAAVSGIAIVANQLGATPATSAVVAEWNTGKVLRARLQKAGSTYTASVAPFLTGMQNPEPVIVGPSGSLLVGDWQTGTIYRVASA